MSDWPREKEVVQRLLDEHAATLGHAARVLEAGCGSSSRFRLPEGAVLDGVDISARQLERNTALTERIQADLQAVELPEGRYDLVICWDVLEHLERPAAAVERLLRAVRPGGLVLLAMPNYHSLEAKITKWTPLWVHTAFYRVVSGRAEAGHDDVGPFTTFLRRETSLPALEAQAAAAGFEVVHRSLYARGHADRLKARSKAAYAAYRGVGRAGQLLTLGKLEPRNSSALLVLRRPAG